MIYYHIAYACSYLICGLLLEPQYADQLPHHDQEKQAVQAETAWWGDISPLCDPDDEVGQLVEALK